MVASAKITDGKLAFANLYMGRYYLVERATGLVLPIDGNGKLYVTGKYPQLNKKLERTGKYSDLARKNNEYADYIYKNQYSAVAESRKLNGSKAWDGYYLSYAKGYLCDEVNHYKTLSYADESTYHIHTEQESQDEVLKSGFSLNKLVSTTGQPSPALKLEGAGFTVYRISKLSKAAQFKQNPDGSYDAASILSAYRKDNYDNATLKYDFTAEGQAIANMFEGNTDTVNAYNTTLTADGDYANGRGNGWMPTDQPAEYRLGEMFTNDEGIFRVEGLPYGQYLVVETTIPKDVFQCDPFIVTVDANSPQSRFTIPAGSVTTASNNYMTFNVLDEELEGYLQLIKTDTETGKAVKIANTSFALYKLDDKGNKTRISMIDPASGSATKKTDVFYTDADGLMKTPEKLPLGRYLIEELQGPEGYFNDPAYYVKFEIKSDRVWQVVGNATNDMDEYIVEEKYCNHETLGQLTIRKLGNVLTDYQDGQFIYTQDDLAGAVYEIHAAADIATPDRQGTCWYKSDDLVATVTTGTEGQVDEVMYNKLQANRARIFRPMVDSLLLLKSQQEHQNAARESIYAEIQRLAKQNHNLERIYAQGYIEDAQYIERKTLIEQQLVEKRVQLSRTSISKNVEQTLKSTRQIEKILDSGPPLTYFDEHTFTEMVKKVSVSNTAIEFELINGMKLSEERTEK